MKKVVMIAIFVLMLCGGAFAEGEAVAETGGGSLGLIAAALSTGLACVGAGIAVAAAGSSALGALSEDPKILGKALIIVALAEGIALYGLIISLLILGKA